MKFNGPGNARPFTGMNMNFNAMSEKEGVNFMGGRANSASFALQHPKLRRAEMYILRQKKILEQEKKALRHIKT